MITRPYFIDFGCKNFQKGSWNFNFWMIIHSFFLLEAGGRNTLGGAKDSWGGNFPPPQQAQTACLGVTFFFVLHNTLTFNWPVQAKELLGCLSCRWCLVQLQNLSHIGLTKTEIIGEIIVYRNYDSYPPFLCIDYTPIIDCGGQTSLVRSKWAVPPRLVLWNINILICFWF